MLNSFRAILLGFIALSVTVVAVAQSTCPTIVEDALSAVDEFCTDLGRNQACYGNIDLSAEAQPDASSFVFETSGDIVDVADILSLQLTELNEDAGTWGVAVMSLQADIPNTLPGQNVTFILFGDVTIENASTDEQSPMQAFYLQTGIGNPACEEAPESGLLVQTPDGVDEVTFNVNGVDVQVGSTVLFQTETVSEDEGELVVTTVEGSASLQFDSENYPAVEGTQIRMPLNSQLLPSGRPGLPQNYEDDRVRPLPVNRLPRQIAIASGLPPEQIELLNERIQNGLPPCGVDGLPPCDRILPILRSGDALPPRDRWGTGFEAGVNCVLRTENSTSEDTNDLPFCPPNNRANRLPPLNAVAEELQFDGDPDEDGIFNIQDVCPFVAGTQEFFGCPSLPSDRDEDTVPDALDLCPNLAGFRENLGCPDAPPDTDEDGIPNVLDRCPNMEGERIYLGCPESPEGVGDGDIDQDGIPNSIDRCPLRIGSAENNGCPRNPRPPRNP